MVADTLGEGKKFDERLELSKTPVWSGIRKTLMMVPSQTETLAPLGIRPKYPSTRTQRYSVCVCVYRAWSS